MKDFNMSVNDLIDEASKNEIASLKKVISNKDSEIFSLKEKIKSLKQKGKWILTKNIQISKSFKELDDDCCFFIDDEDKIAFDYLEKGE